MVKVYGQLVDQQTRCVHYHSELDVVALKCFECQKYYPCFQCHNEAENHQFAPYPENLTEDKVVLCGVCQHELRIAEYKHQPACPYCQHPFNPKCAAHYDLYFKQQKG